MTARYGGSQLLNLDVLFCAQMRETGIGQYIFSNTGYHSYDGRGQVIPHDKIAFQPLNLFVTNP